MGRIATLLVFGALLASCRAIPLGLSSDRALLKEAGKRALTRTDTVRATIITPAQTDTFVVNLPGLRDTLRLEGPERVRIEVVRLSGETVRIAATCPPDTLEVALPCPPMPICPEPRAVSFWAAWRYRGEGVGIVAVVGLCYLAIGVFRKLRERLYP